MEPVFSEVGIGDDLQAHVIKALEGADTGSAYGNSPATVVKQLCDGLTPHADKLGMHLVAFHLIALDRLERASPHVESQFLTIYAMSVESGQDLRRKVQASRRSSHTALDFRIDSLVGGLVAILRLTVEIRRNRQLTHGINDLGERDFGGDGLRAGRYDFPLEINAVGCTVDWTSRSGYS